jgi:hypothetical protein
MFSSMSSKLCICKSPPNPIPGNPCKQVAGWLGGSLLLCFTTQQEATQSYPFYYIEYGSGTEVLKLCMSSVYL